MVRIQPYLFPGVVLALGLLSCGCAGSHQATEPASPQHITAQEIERSGFSFDVYTLVQRIRPNWLKKSGPHSITGGDDIRVYVNGQRFGDPSALRFYNTMDIESMRFLDPGRATVRYGVGHSHGAIVVRLRGGGPSTS